MSARNLALPAPLASLRQQATARWQALGRRERRLVALALVLAAAGLVWLVAVQPALKTLREAPPLIDRLDNELQQMRSLAAEAREWRGAPSVAPAQSTAALQAAVARLGAHARLTPQGDRATVQFTGIGGEALRSFLAEIRSAARARPIEAQLARAAVGYDGTLVLAVGGNP